MHSSIIWKTCNILQIQTLSSILHLCWHNLLPALFLLSFKKKLPNSVLICVHIMKGLLKLTSPLLPLWWKDQNSALSKLSIYNTILLIIILMLYIPLNLITSVFWSLYYCIFIIQIYNILYSHLGFIQIQGHRLPVTHYCTFI